MNTFYINFIQIENAEYFNVDIFMLSNDQEIYTKKVSDTPPYIHRPQHVFSVSLTEYELVWASLYSIAEPFTRAEGFFSGHMVEWRCNCIQV